MNTGKTIIRGTSAALGLRTVLWFVLAALTLAPGAQATTIFSNISTSDKETGLNLGKTLLEQFTPLDDYVLTGVAARLMSLE